MYQQAVLVWSATPSRSWVLVIVHISLNVMAYVHEIQLCWLCC